MINITQELYKQVRSIISDWNQSNIYAISFFVYFNEGYEYNGYNNISTFAISYNTEQDCEGAGEYDEERWNYAFWRQNEIPIIDPDNPDSLISLLFEWYKEKGVQNVGYEDTDNCYDSEYNYIGKGPIGHYELISLIAEVGKRLQEEGFIENHFQKKVPIIIHGLEYAWYDVEATKYANPNGEAEVFLKAIKELGMI